MKLLKTFNAVAGLAAVLTLSGCGSSYFTSRSENPIVKDAIGNGILDNKASVGVIGTDASRRMILFRLLEDATKICAEPSPDAATELAKKLAVAMSAQAQGAGEGKLSVDSEMVSKITQLLTRTQGLQLFRDASFQSCQDFVNSAIDGKELNRRHDQLLKAVEHLIELELQLQYGRNAAPAKPAP
ncbi:MAG TPA: hypothetical protein VIF12_08710 [Micavibrio sp.]